MEDSDDDLRNELGLPSAASTATVKPVGEARRPCRAMLREAAPLSVWNCDSSPPRASPAPGQQSQRSERPQSPTIASFRSMTWSPRSLSFFWSLVVATPEPPARLRQPQLYGKGTVPDSPSGALKGKALE